MADVTDEGKTPIIISQYVEDTSYKVAQAIENILKRLLSFIGGNKNYKITCH